MQLKQGSSDRHGELSISYCRKIIFSIIALSITIFLIYANSFDCSWHFDDIPNIRENPNLHLNQLSWNHIKRTLFSDLRNPQTLYRPVACLSFALNYFFCGLDIFGYHLVNTIIHVVSSVFLFLFLYHTLNLPSLRPGYALKSYSIAILATIMWAINPVQTQAVTYIVQRMASLAGMFYIISMFFYLKARTCDKTGRKLLHFILCFVSFILAFGSKENAVMLPLSLLLYETLIIQEDTGEFLRSNLKVFVIVLGATLLAGLIFLQLKNESIFSLLSGYEGRPFSITQRLLTEPRIVIFYVTLLLYPLSSRLSVAHSTQVSTSLFSPMSTFISTLLILGTIAYLILRTKKHPLFSFCLLFFFLNHMVESTIFPLELIFEHRNYIPSMLFFVPIAIGFSHLLERFAMKKPMKLLISAFIVFSVIGFGHATFVRNFAWKDGESLWMDALEKAPDQFRVHHNLGVYYQDQGQVDQAVSEFEKALISPGIHRVNEKIITYYHLGRLYNDLGDYEKAKSFYQKALHLDPNFPYAMGNLVPIYEREGNFSLAEQYLKRAIELNPGDPFINFNMGLYYLKQGRPEQAIGHFMISMKESRLKSRALLYLGIACKQKGWLGRAAIYFRKSAAADRKTVSPHLHLAEVLLRGGREAMALREAEIALRMMLHKEGLFYQTVDLISREGRLGGLQPPASLVLPLLHGICEKEGVGGDEWKAYLSKALEKYTEIK